MSNIQKLTDQILGQNTTDKWSGQGFGSAEANAKDMAKILDGIGITDIRQFGVVNKNTYLPEMKQSGFRGTVVTPTGRWYSENRSNGTGRVLSQDFISADEAKNLGLKVDAAMPKSYADMTSNKYAFAQTITVPSGGTPTYVNKETGQAVPNTYSERQTGNAWGGTFAGDGNTGYRVQFTPDGTPVFYTTGASSKDSTLTDLAPILGLGLMFVPGLQGAGAALGSALGAGTGAVATGLGNAIIQGTLAEATGGDFLKGAALSGIGSVAGGFIQPGLTEALGGGAAANIGSSALVGGAMSELSGGDFVKGALLSGIGSGINQAKLSLADDYINSVEPGIGYDPATSPTELDVIAAFPELAPEPVIYTSFTPDYSLATAAPVLADMGAQGIQVPTITDLVNVVSQPVDYSLPVSDSGLGLQMPTAPNLDSMGGGQGIVIPVDGGVITEAGFIPDTYVPDLGDPNSFINQPAPNVEVNIPELPAEQPKDISGELAALDLVKALAPIAVTAALAKDQPQAATDEQTGYPILPIPADWKAPEYSMAFTPSASIDFGSPDLLQGTQWANAAAQPRQMDYTLSDVINTLNYQAVPFVQQQMQPIEQSYSVPDILQQFQTKPTVGMNDIIGGLNGRQVSISDIISGIQSQYG